MIAICTNFTCCFQAPRPSSSQRNTKRYFICTRPTITHIVFWEWEVTDKTVLCILINKERFYTSTSSKRSWIPSPWWARDNAFIYKRGKTLLLCLTSKTTKPPKFPFNFWTKRPTNHLYTLFLIPKWSVLGKTEGTMTTVSS